MTHRTAPIIVLFALAASVLYLSGCGSKNGGPSSASGSSTSPPLAVKSSYKVGFSQVESNNPWRIAETQSIKDEAAKQGAQIIVTDATGSDAKQLSDVNALLAQGVDILLLAPHSEKPLAQAVLKAKSAGIPVILLDRRVDAKMAVAGRDYVTFIGSDFVQQGKRAGDWLVKATGGKAKIIELEGTVGSSPAIDRKTGFDTAIKSAPGMQIVASQSADFNRDKGREVTETLLQAHPDATVVYAHNDEMAFGAIAAITAAGKKPGKDIRVLSIDGSKDALQAIADGKMNYVVQSSPFFGPLAFSTMKDYASGKKIAPSIVLTDKAYDSANARAEISSAY